MISRYVCGGCCVPFFLFQYHFSTTHIHLYIFFVYQGVIPATIGDLENLTNLRLSFNSLHGTVPPEFQELHHLVEVHLHGNRLEGDMPLFIFHRSENHSLIADCDYPTDFNIPISCPNCTMCCK